MDASSDGAFDFHRMRGTATLHRNVALLILTYTATYSFSFHGELALVGTLWPNIYKIKVTLYLSMVALHGAVWLSFHGIRFCFGSFGSIFVDTAHQAVCLFVVSALSFDDHRLVRLLDLNESYATQISKSHLLSLRTGWCPSVVVVRTRTQTLLFQQHRNR